MNPLQKNKIDVSSLSPEEQRLFRLYGKLPSRSDHFAKHLKDRKYFDSGDYAMSKAGKGDGVDTGTVGSQHPVPEKIPHLSSPPPAATPGTNSHHGSISGPSTNGSTVGGITLGIPGSNTHPLQPAGSPVKESSFLNQETNAADLEEGQAASVPAAEGQIEGIPIRR